MKIEIFNASMTDTSPQMMQAEIVKLKNSVNDWLGRNKITKCRMKYLLSIRVLICVIEYND